MKLPHKIQLDRVYNADCESIANWLAEGVDLIYADIIYDDWQSVPLDSFVECLRPGGALWLQTDYRSVAQLKLELDKRLVFVNWICWQYNWGGRPKDAFGRKHDDILYYTKPGGKRTFNADAVQIPKVALINSTKTTQIPTDVWTGNFYTTSPERIKNPVTGKGFIWQKPMWILERILLATSNKGDLIFEPYLGTGTACVVAKKLDRHFIGCDTSKQMVEVAKKRLATKE